MNSDVMDTEALIDAVRHRYGDNLSVYAADSLRRRIRYAANILGKPRVADLTLSLVSDEAVYANFLEALSVPVTSLFRDADVFKAITSSVFQELHNASYIKIWHAGCASGEEVYTLAILLCEHGLLDKTYIYATDNNRDALRTAQRGIYRKDAIAAAETNYLLAGGQFSLKDYFSATRFSSTRIKAHLRDRICFSHHDLSCHDVFSTVHLILCRNVLIYFASELQTRAISLFSESLYAAGVLCVGQREPIFSCPEFELLDPQAKLYRKPVHRKSEPWSKSLMVPSQGN